MAHYAFQQYQRSQTETASQGELILMLYGGAIKYLNKARYHIESDNKEGAHKNVIAAQNIVLELMYSLDMRAGDVAKNLFGLYNYLYRRLVEANMRKDATIVEEVTTMLRDLQGAWEHVVAQSGAAAGAGPVGVVVGGGSPAVPVSIASRGQALAYGKP